MYEDDSLCLCASVSLWPIERRIPPVSGPLMRAVTAPETQQRRRAGQEVGKRVAIEYGEKRRLCFVQHAFQTACPIDRARVALGVEALDKVEVRLRGADHVADVDVFRPPLETESSA